MQRFEEVFDLLPKGHVFDGELVVLDDAAFLSSTSRPLPVGRLPIVGTLPSGPVL
jgi:hypothetical protein